MKAKYLYIISMLALGFVACQQGGEEQLLPSNGEMQFNIATTRVANGAFEAEDKVGLYVTDFVDATTPAPLQISGNRANNEVLLFDGAKWATERPIYWGEGKSDVYAYYPYIAEVADVDNQPFSVALDQTIEGAYEASDLLWAKAEGVQQSGGAVSLAMKHQMSRLVVKIMAGKEYIGSLPADATVHLHSTVTDARISLANGSVVKDPYGGANSIKMRNLGIRTFAEGEAVVYEAIVVPQMLETSVPLLEINSKSVSYLLEDMFNFKPGVSYTYTAVLNTSTTAIKVEIGCEIEDWNNIGGGSEGEGGSGSEGEDDGIDLSLYTDLSAEGTANCYLIKGAGNYKFKAVQGNSDATVGNVKKTEVLWESFGTDVMPNVGDLIATTGYKNGYVYFSTPAEFKNGNASIAVRNSKDIILWSWHIWCSEEGWNDHIYPNNAGTMMDRNLGATSATPGDIGAFGLLYQWGRKDPFMGSITSSSNVCAVSTGSWNTVSGSVNMTFAEENPMTFAKGWAGGGMFGWQTSDSVKGVYDPCPVGYRVPDGGPNGFWMTALAETIVKDAVTWHSAYSDGAYGLCWILADGEATAWYPATGYMYDYNDLKYCHHCNYWSATPSTTTSSSYSYYLNGQAGIPCVYPENVGSRYYGYAVRCVKE